MFNKNFPKNGKKYYFFDKNNDIVQTYWFNCSTDRINLKNKNVFYTLRDAKLNQQAHLKKPKQY